MKRQIKILGFSLAAFALLLSPGQGGFSVRQIASCMGGLDGVVAPNVPFGTDFFEQFDATAYQESKDYWFNYLGQVSNNFMAGRQAIRNAYGLDMPAGYRSPFTTPSSVTSVNPNVANLASSSPAFMAFAPQSTYGTTTAFQIPVSAVPVGSAAAPLGSFGGPPMIATANGAIPATVGAAANLVGF